MSNKRNGAAAAYLGKVQEAKAGDPVFDLAVPSGFVWKVRKPDLTPYVICGELPVDLVSEVARSIGHGEENVDDTTSEKMSPEDEAKILIFMREVVQAAAVEPRITTTPDGPDEIHPKFVDWPDFEAIFTWAVTGGGDVERLRRFRKGQDKKLASRARGPKLGNETERATRT